MMESLIIGLDKIQKREETMVVVSMKASSFSSPPPMELLMRWCSMKMVSFCLERIVV